MGGTAQLLAVAVLATSFYPIRHGAEIKPYASDLLAALILLALALEVAKVAPIEPLVVGPDSRLAPAHRGVLSRRVRRGRNQPRPGSAGAEVGAEGRSPGLDGLTTWCSSPRSWRSSCRVPSFRPPTSAESYRTGCWAESFPPLERPWTLPLWFLDIHAGTMMAYPVGDRHGGSIATLLCVIAGRPRPLPATIEKTTLALLVAPLGLGLIAAFLGRYPYGGAPRIMQYAAPSICLLAGLGLAVLLARIRADTRPEAWRCSGS